MKKSNLIKLFVLCIVMIAIITGITYAGTEIYQKRKTNFNSAYTSKLIENDVNTVWIGTFQLAWNELIEYLGTDIEFDENIELLEELNKKSFIKKMISESDYYIKVGKNSLISKDEIYEEIENKFKIEKFNLLDNIDFSDAEGITIYSLLNKESQFFEEFDELNSRKFNDTDETIKCFGIDSESKEKLYKNVEILCYDSNNNNYGVKLNTQEDEEVILYRTDTTGSFEEIYNEMLECEKEYTENKEFQSIDLLTIPYMNMNFVVNYDELCGKNIKGTDGIYISNALQTVNFLINPTGGKLLSESSVTTDALSDARIDSRNFDFSKPFYLFLKEKDKEIPYFAIRIYNTDFLEKVGNSN